MAVEVLLIMRGQTQALEPSTLGVALHFLHQSPSVAPPTLRLRHDHRLNKQAAAVTYDPGQPSVTQQALCLLVALQQNQADRELRAGLLEGVDPRGLAPLPLRVDQVSTGDQQVWTLVDRNSTDLLLHVLS